MLHYSGKRILVLGLGETGIATVRWLVRHAATVIVADSRMDPPGLETLKAEFPAVPVHCGPFVPELFDDVDEIVASPGVAVASLPTRRPVIGDIEVFARAIRHMPARVIAITGSNGKSTVTSMVGEMCRAAGLKTIVAGNIGLPVLAGLLEAEEAMAGGAVAPQAYVLELSSFQLETTYTLKASSATVLNVSEDHLDRYDGMVGYATAKSRVFNGEGVQILNRDDAWSREMAMFGRVVRSFGLDAPQQAGDFGIEQRDGRTALLEGTRFLMWADELPLAGLHNVANALAALALTRAVDLPVEPLVAALKQFKGLPHRVEFVRDVRGVSFYDDSKGTNVGATVAALNGLSRPVVLIAGGDGKGQDFAPLAPAVARIVKAVILIGRDAPRIRQALASTPAKLIEATTLEAAVEMAWGESAPGDLVLLSPACASLDMFRNYAHRAQVFIDAAQALGQREERA